MGNLHFCLIDQHPLPNGHFHRQKQKKVARISDEKIIFILMIRNESADFQKIKYGTLSRVIMIFEFFEYLEYLGNRSKYFKYSKSSGFIVF